MHFFKLFLTPEKKSFRRQVHEEHRELLRHQLKSSLLTFTLASLSFVSPFSQAANKSTNQIPATPTIPKTLTRSIEFGVGAGFLVGIAAISGFKKNLRANLDVHSIFRGMSYGLYGGIILGLYLTYFADDDDLQKREREFERDQYGNPLQDPLQDPLQVPLSSNVLGFSGTFNLAETNIKVYFNFTHSGEKELFITAPVFRF